MVIWLIGLSGAAKTTIGRHLYEIWKAEAPNTVLVDGDEIRALLNHQENSRDYTIEARRANAERITNLCAWLDGQDINTVCCILSLFPEMRQRNRDIFSRYFEVYVSAPMEVLIQRDEKGLYGPALRGEIENVVGVDIEFPTPTSADLVVDNGSDGTDPRTIAEEIYAKVFGTS